MIASRTIEANSRTQNKSQPLSIIYVPIEKLKLNPENPRLHNKNQLRQIARSIKAFGFTVPILVDEKGQVVAGHGRVEAAKLLGISELPTIRLEHLTQTQVTAFTIADNRLAENAQWNNKLLAEQLKTLSETELDFSVDVTGFEMDEIDVLVEGLTPAPKGNRDPADTLPTTTTAAPVSKPGDVWLLGHHRVLCGNSLDESSFSTLMQDRRANVVITDPPCNLNVNQVVGLGRIPHKGFKLAADEMNDSGFADFLAQVFDLLASHTVNGSLHYIFVDSCHMREILATGKHAYTELKDVCVWVKDNGSTGSLYKNQHELILVFQGGHGERGNDVELRKYRGHRTNVWNYSGATEERNLGELHRRVKPVALVADALMDCTSRRDVILDPFLGTGTTVIAAERTGRVCYGIELDPQCVDAIIRRWQSLAGQSATQASSGQTFAELQQEAGNEQQ